MSSGKIGSLVLYAVLAVLSVTQAGTTIGNVSNWIIGLLVVVHAIEVVVFLPLARKAGGSLPAHLLNLFVFGYFHMQEIKPNADNVKQ